MFNYLIARRKGWGKTGKENERFKGTFPFSELSSFLCSAYFHLFIPPWLKLTLRQLSGGDDPFRKGWFSSLVGFLVNKDEDTISLVGSELPVPVQGQRFVHFMA